MRFWQRSIALATLAAATCTFTAAAVTLTTGDETVKGETVPVYYLENQWMKVVIIRAATSTGNTEAIGQPLYLFKKTGANPTTSQLTVIQSTAPYVSNAKSYIAYRDRISSKDPVAGSQTISDSLDTNGTLGAITVNETSGVPGITVEKIYRLRDNVKWLEVAFRWINNSGADYTSGTPGSGVESIIYAVPGGTSGNSSGDEQFAKTTAGLAVSATNSWFGKGGTPLYPELIEGWHAVVDPVADVVLADTWDLEAQRPFMKDNVTAARGGYFSNRFTFEVFFETIPNGQALPVTQNLIVDDGLTDVSYAKEGALIAGITMNAKSFSTEGSATATFKLNSLNPTNSVSYDIRNMRVEDAQNGTKLTSINLANISGAAVPANQHVVAGTRQFVLRDAALVTGRTYVLKADLYEAGGSTAITTLSSRPFLVDQADVKVQLYQDPTSGNYFLENEVFRFIINATTSQVTHFIFKTASDRNQTITSTPPYPYFRDYTAVGTGTSGFSDYAVTLDPKGTDTPTRKSISFQATGADGQIVKTYSLQSLSRSMQVDLAFTPDFYTLIGGGFYSDVPMAPGGTGGGNDVFSAHTASGLLVIHPDTMPSLTRYWMGAANNPSGDGTAVMGDQPELNQGWMATTDTTATDAVVLGWDLAKQRSSFSLTPAGASGPVTMNSIAIAADYGRHVGEIHFTNLPAGVASVGTVYLMGDTAFKLVGYAEPNRVMAGIWPAAGAVNQGETLTVQTGLTNTGTTARTFDLKAITLVKDTGETTASGADVMGIALEPAAHAAPNLGVPIPAAQVVGTYHVTADLYEGAEKVATLQSLAFAINAGLPPANGDVNGDSAVNGDDVLLALKIASGLVAADAGNVSRGDLSPTPGDKALTLEDALAIQRKVSNPS